MLRSLLAASVIVGLAFGALFAFQQLNGRVEFTLMSARGPVSLRDFRGKDVVIYFGFTSCPHICPVALSRLSKLLPKLPAPQRAQIVPIFVSVDYRGDTPERVDTYFKAFFGDNGVGLAGSKEQIDRAIEPFKARYAIEENKDAPTGYVVAHPDVYYLVDKKGHFVRAVPLDSPNEAILTAFKDW